MQLQMFIRSNDNLCNQNLCNQNLLNIILIVSCHCHTFMVESIAPLKILPLATAIQHTEP